VFGGIRCGIKRLYHDEHPLLSELAQQPIAQYFLVNLNSPR
jgi:hypothetical protein